jgi:hypothetical protein
VFVGTLLSSAGVASASVITYTPDFEFSASGDDYTGTITYTLADQGADQVLFTITWGPVIDSGEYLAGAYLNLDTDNIDPASLLFSPGLGTCSGCVVSSIGASTDTFQADGDGKFDLVFNFDEANANRLNQGDSYSVLMEASGLSALSFTFQSAVAGGNGVWYAAARARGLEGGSGSGWFGDNSPDVTITQVPEPASALLMGVALSWCTVRVRRNFSRR